MHFTIHKIHLFKALSHVQSVVEKRNTIPILSNVLLTATYGRLSLTATDLDIEIVETTPADIITEGAVTVPAHMFYEIVRKLPDSVTITFKVNPENGRISLDAGRSGFTLPYLPKDDFPLMVSSDTGTEFSMPASDLKLILDKNKFAISQEETRYYLGGIYFHTDYDEANPDKPHHIIGVATDGHRLSRLAVLAPEEVKGMTGVIIPRKTVLELRKLIEDTKVDVLVTVTETKIRFFMDNILLTSKLIDGTFPAYQNVIPQGNDKKVIAKTKDVISAVDRVATVSSDKVPIVKLTLETGKMTFDAQNTDFGSATEELEAEYEGDRLEIGFNARYLLEILIGLDTNNAVISMGDAHTPIVINNIDDTKALYVLMPMRI